MKCSKCGGQTEKIKRAGEHLFLFCRACQLPHDDLGNPLFTSRSLADRYNPLQAARDAIRKSHPGKVAPVTRTALEVALLQATQEAYFAGIKDGVLLAYSKDIDEGEPMMEKVGVSKEQLIAELQEEYNLLKEKEHAGLSKEASTQNQSRMAAVAAKIDDLQSTAE